MVPWSHLLSGNEHPDKRGSTMLMIDAQKRLAHPVIDDLCRLITQHRWEARFEQAFCQSGGSTRLPVFRALSR